MVKIVIIESETKKNNIINYLRTRRHPNGFTRSQKVVLKKTALKFEIKNNELKLRSSSSEKSFVCLYEHTRIKDIVIEAHGVDHASSRVTFTRISEKYDGITHERVHELISNCNSCRLDTVPAVIPAITPIIASYPRERLIVDAVNLSRYSQNNDGYCYLFNFIDSFTKYAWSYPARDKSADTFNKILMKHFYSEGKSDIFHSDNGTEFRNSLVLSTSNRWGITEVHGRAYHPKIPWTDRTF